MRTQGRAPCSGNPPLRSAGKLLNRTRGGQAKSSRLRRFKVMYGRLTAPDGLSEGTCRRRGGPRRRRSVPSPPGSRRRFSPGYWRPSRRPRRSNPTDRPRCLRGSCQSGSSSPAPEWWRPPRTRISGVPVGDEKPVAGARDRVGAQPDGHVAGHGCAPSSRARSWNWRRRWPCTPGRPCRRW